MAMNEDTNQGECTSQTMPSTMSTASGKAISATMAIWRQYVRSSELTPLPFSRSP